MRGNESLAVDRQGRWGLIGILAGYGAIAAVVPTMVDVSLLEDWVYAWSVEQLVESGSLEVLDLAGPNVVFEAFWGWLFAFGGPVSFGALRVSTLVLSALGAVGFWVFLGELGVPARWRQVGVGAYLFNPLAMGLSYSFMTDAHAMALAVISLAFFAKGFNTNRAAYFIIGSLFAAIGYLSRPQALAPLVGAVAVVMLDRRHRSARNLVALTAIPAMTAMAMLAWQRGGTSTQGEFVDRALDASIGNALGLGGFTMLVALGYVGVFVLPLTVSFVGLRPFPSSTIPIVAGIGVVALSVFARAPIPISGDWFSRTGLGPSSIANHGTAPDALFGLWVWPLTVASAVSVALLAALIVPRVKSVREEAVASMMSWCLLVSLLLLVPPSILFRYAAPDRYYLLLLPIVIGLALWALRDKELRRGVAWAVVGVFAAFSIGGVHDALAAEEAVWNLARRAEQSGIPLDHLSAGAAWDGYHFGPATSQSGSLDYEFFHAGWWLTLMAPQITPEYVITLTDWGDGPALDREEYSTWLSTGRGSAYLVEFNSAGDVR